MIGIPVRLKTAASLALLGLLALLAGIGQLTFWAPADTVTASAPGETKAAPLTVIEQGLLDHKGGPSRITIKGEGNFVLAVGRPDDVEAWVGKTAHNTVSGVSEDGKSLQIANTAGEATAPAPSGSDLWVETENASGQLEYSWNPPADGEWSLLLASDGTKPAPASIAVTYPNDTAMPWAVPLIVFGAVLIAAGAALPLLGKLFGARKNGKGGSGGSGTGGPGSTTAEAAGPATATPTPLKEEAPKEKGGTTALRVLAAGAVSLALAGTSVGAAHATQTPSPAASQPAAAPESSPVVVDSQLNRILEQVANAVSAGDAARDAAKLKPRVAGTELLVRTQNYKIRAKVSGHQARMPVRASKLLGSVVTTQRSWPRTVVAVTQGDGNVVPQVLTLSQPSPRENYKLVATAPLQPGTSFPAIPRGGTQQSAAGNKTGLLYSGTEAMAALADRLTKPDSAFKSKLVEGTGSPYISDVLDYQADAVKAGSSGTFKFTHAPVPAETTVFRTSDGGALVLGRLDFVFSTKPKAEGDTLIADKAAAVLAGGESTKVGLSQTFAESVAIYVPPAGSTEPMKLVAAFRGLVAASFK
ncbi:hypothetical protein BIU82_01420 [Arthrobacter sp. SW1]|uniref:hypothetical protein n=1 Tax=Arthrobacter sp. SW1 TaxID=1920889 RepID=UPI000877B9D2|nr:hypothetical protein [Arthrobacter sp. SW1]OFI39740.1 hypothetical protein BIU82_01420 [Arthrobacter sp. SW1]